VHAKLHKRQKLGNRFQMVLKQKNTFAALLEVRAHWASARSSAHFKCPGRAPLKILEMDRTLQLQEVRARGI